MAAKKNEIEKYKITVVGNKCTEVGAGGVAFANGVGYTADPWIAEWFKTHDGYEVEEIPKVEGTPEDSKK